MSNRAWVTLASNDSYGLGALVLAHSLRRAGSAYSAVVLITPSVTEAMRDRLRAVFAEVVIVDVLDSKDAAHLALLQRPELGITFTKIHCWNLTQYEKCVFLDADTLIVQNCDELFEREELSAAPDVGWPDCFNSGVFVYKPSAETFASLIKFAQERGSFDGGDQGLLNSYFSDWAHGDIDKHLPFLYNVTSAAFYSYLPALQHYGQNLKIIHFIGATKPWLQQFNWETRICEAPQHLRDFLQLWWDIFVANVHSVLDTSMVEIEEALSAASPQGPFIHTEPRLDYCHYEPILDPESEFPWHHPDAQIPDVELNVPEIDMTQFYDPWDIYKGHIPPNAVDSSSSHIESHKSDNYEEIRKYAWDYVSPQHYQHDVAYSDVQNLWKPDNRQHAQVERVELRGNMWEYNTEHNHNRDQQYSQNVCQETPNYTQDRQVDQTPHCNIDSFHEFQYNRESVKDQSQNNYYSDYRSDYSQQDNQSHITYSHEDNQSHSSYSHQSNQSHSSYSHNFSHDQSDQNYEFSLQKDSKKNYYPTQQQRVDYVYYVHIDHEKIVDRHHHKHDDAKTEEESKINGFAEDDCESFENIRPRHPYDGFYLRHRMTIDSRGRKICTHEVPPTPTPSPPESPIPEVDSQQRLVEEKNEHPIDTEDQTGVAGNFARIVLGAGAQREALDDLTRRQGWEAGNIDYMGADAFDNIWAKITQTLNQPRISPPKQSTPLPAEVPALHEQVVESPPPQAPIEPPSPIGAPAPEAAPILTSSPTSTPAESINVIASETKLPESVPAADEIVPPAKPEAKAQISAAVTEPAKVVAAGPTEPKQAVEAPVIAPVTAAPAPVAPTEPATIPSATSEVKKDTTPVPKTPPPAPVATAAAPKTEVTPVKGASTTDSPPLANTPSKEELPVVPAAKSEERRKPAGRLQIPPAAADALPTPDSELEDAASLANAIIAGELRTPTVTSPTPPAPPADPALPPSPLSELSAVSLSQIGVESKPKTTTAARIESSVTEAAADVPKKKVVKKVLKKDGGGGEASMPVPPPRKKEKKPKEK